MKRISKKTIIIISVILISFLIIIGILLFKDYKINKAVKLIKERQYISAQEYISTTNNEDYIELVNTLITCNYYSDIYNETIDTTSYTAFLESFDMSKFETLKEFNNNMIKYVTIDKYLPKDLVNEEMDMLHRCNIMVVENMDSFITEFSDNIDDEAIIKGFNELAHYLAEKYESIIPLSVQIFANHFKQDKFKEVPQKYIDFLNINEAVIK